METYFTEFTNYLAQLPEEIALWLGILGLVVFTLALCIGWLIGRRRVVRIRKQIEGLRLEKENLQKRLQTNEEEQKKLAHELVDLTTEKDDLLIRLQTTQSRNSELNHRLTEARTTNEQLQATNQSYATTIEDLNNQVIGLKTRNEQFLHQGDTGGGAAGPTSLELAERVARLERKLDALIST
ncbi:hypothetical protein [Neolewinella sp.]|uniref:hypothetical protein n=1 Tax=Neolewinella sp. TaxID=2993543 RepID=UPI003B526512